MKINLMSFNTLHCENYKTRKIDFDLMAKTIKESGADVVALNEIRGRGKREDYQEQTEILAKLLGFPHFYFAQAILVDGCNPYGNALISRYPIKNAQTIRIPDPLIKIGRFNFETRCILKAEIVAGSGFTVMVTHFGLNKSEQKNAVETVLKNLPDKKCVLMGDFNATPENPVLAPIKSKLFDTAEVFSNTKFSFPSDKPDKKIDYIFTSRDVKVIKADLIQVIASDHLPHTAQIEI
ncbi:MAG: endonuclease/exonuclease/phosphatase family protein [Clostridia bacterium]|nr:endonuclease/exonuclease/phosphatase family protein [Clostridia bacterium]